MVRVNLTSDSHTCAELDELREVVAARAAAVLAELDPGDPASELGRFNADRRERVPASPVLRRFVLVARWAAEASDGRLDVTRPPGSYASLGVGADGWVRRGAGVTLAPGDLVDGLAADLAAELVPGGIGFEITVGAACAMSGAGAVEALTPA